MHVRAPVSIMISLDSLFHCISGMERERGGGSGYKLETHRQSHMGTILPIIARSRSRIPETARDSTLLWFSIINLICAARRTPVKIEKNADLVRQNASSDHVFIKGKKDYVQSNDDNFLRVDVRV